MKKILSIIILGLGLAACSTTVPVNYIASPSLKGEGAVAVGKFSYSPSVEGKVAPNQFQHATVSIGQIFLSENVSDLLEKSLRKELIAAGFDPDGQAKVQISGSVDRFLYDWTGFTEMDMYLDINYTVRKDGVIAYENIIKTHKALPKAPGYDSEAVRSVISESIDKLFLDLRAKKLI